MVAEQLRRAVNRMPVLDLSSHCPVCGGPYQPGEEVLTLGCLSFGEASGDPGEQVPLGHHRCVLPRLLTLLAGFQPEPRFTLASEPRSAADGR